MPVLAADAEPKRRRLSPAWLLVLVPLLPVVFVGVTCVWPLDVDMGRYEIWARGGRANGVPRGFSHGRSPDVRIWWLRFRDYAYEVGWLRHW